MPACGEGASVVVVAMSLASFLISGCFLFKKQRDVYAEAKPAADPLRPGLWRQRSSSTNTKSPRMMKSACSASKTLTFDPKIVIAQV